MAAAEPAENRLGKGKASMLSLVDRQPEECITVLVEPKTRTELAASAPPQTFWASNEHLLATVTGPTILQPDPWRPWRMPSPDAPWITGTTDLPGWDSRQNIQRSDRSLPL